MCRGARSGVLASEGDFRATSLETLRQLVIAGMGITLLPELAISTQDRRRGRTRVRPFVAPVPYRRVALAYRREHPQRDALRLLADFVREHAPESVQPRRGARD